MASPSPASGAPVVLAYLKEIRIPSADLTGATFAEALEFVRFKLWEQDRGGGVSILADSPPSAIGVGAEAFVPEEPFRVADVSAYELLRGCADRYGKSFHITRAGVVFTERFEFPAVELKRGSRDVGYSYPEPTADGL